MHLVTSGGRLGFYKEKGYNVLWGMAEKLVVPVFLHPTFLKEGEVFNKGGVYASKYPVVGVIGLGIMV